MATAPFSFAYLDVLSYPSSFRSFGRVIGQLSRWSDSRSVAPKTTEFRANLCAGRSRGSENESDYADARLLVFFVKVSAARPRRR